MAPLISPASATSQRFRDAVSGGGQAATLVQVLSGGEIVAEIPDLTAGSVALDGRASIRGRCDLTIADDGSLGWTPEDAGDLLAPFGNELRVCRGFAWPDGSEVVALGIFRIEESIIDDSGDSLSVAISALDRAQILSDATFEEPYSVAGGTKVTDTLTAVAQAAMPAIELDFAETDIETPALLANEGEDRWAFMQGLAVAVGAELYFDDDGVLVLRPAPSTVGDPVAAWTLAEGEGGVLLRADRAWTREGTNNRIIVTGENPALEDDAPTPRGVATDDNPASPTYYEGPFGRKPYHATEYAGFISDDTQAEDAAAGLLARRLGITQRINFGAIVDPAMRPSEIVRIRRERLGVDEDDLIDSLTIPLGSSESMSGSARATQRIV